MEAMLVNPWVVYPAAFCIGFATAAVVLGVGFLVRYLAAWH